MKESLGIIGLDSIHYYVHDLERTRELYTDKLDFMELGTSCDLLEAKGKQHSAVFQAGQCRIVVSEPRGTGGRAWRFLQKHPEGVGTLVFRVEDIEKTFHILEERGGTPMTTVQWSRLTDGSQFGQFSITTPFGDTTFRFVQRNGLAMPFPGFRRHSKPKGGLNQFQFSHVDHISSNFPTMQPVVLWLREVLGFESYWDIPFHTTEAKKTAQNNSGIKSMVMWDPHSKFKFALNEPARPNFRASQINLFNEAHRGAGVQHIALACADIQTTVRVLKSNGVAFMKTPETYYDALPQRLQDIGVGDIEESIDSLRDLGILVDGENKGAYLLQVFLKDLANQYSDINAGPFLLQIIQRRGDRGFGAGNFRALFDTIERNKSQSQKRRQTL